MESKKETLKTLKVACNAIKKVKLVGHTVVAIGNWYITKHLLTVKYCRQAFIMLSLA